MHSNTDERDALVTQHLGLLSQCVRIVRHQSKRAQGTPPGDLAQAGAVALLEVADRDVAFGEISSFSAYARTPLLRAMHRHVAEWHHGGGYWNHPPTTFTVRTNTQSQIDNAEPMVMSPLGNAHWVRDAINKPPRSVHAMFASAGYSISGRNQMVALRRRLEKMAP